MYVWHEKLKAICVILKLFTHFVAFRIHFRPIEEHVREIRKFAGELTLLGTIKRLGCQQLNMIDRRTNLTGAKQLAQRSVESILNGERLFFERRHDAVRQRLQQTNPTLFEIRDLALNG